MPKPRWIASSSSRSPTIPSMSSPRCVCASNTLAPAGSSARAQHGVTLEQSVRAVDRVHTSSVWTVSRRQRRARARRTRPRAPRRPRRSGRRRRSRARRATPCRSASTANSEASIAARRDPRRGERELVRQQHGRRAVRSGRGDVDVDRDVLVDRRRGAASEASPSAGAGATRLERSRGRASSARSPPASRGTRAAAPMVVRGHGPGSLVLGDRERDPVGERADLLDERPASRRSKSISRPPAASSGDGRRRRAELELHVARPARGRRGRRGSRPARARRAPSRRRSAATLSPR